MSEQGDTPNNDHVICPNCCNQFRAIPVNVQSELSAMTAQLAECKRELHVAIVQMSESDDKIICGHVRKAHSIIAAIQEQKK